jgi:hypothetical protein
MSNLPASIMYVQNLISNTNEEILVLGIKKALHEAGGKNYLPLCCLANEIISDLEHGTLSFLTSEELQKRLSKEDDDDDELSGPITKKQIGYIAGLTKKLGYNREDLPMKISPVSYYKDLTEGQAIKVIDTLLEEEKALKLK